MRYLLPALLIFGLLSYSALNYHQSQLSSREILINSLKSQNLSLSQDLDQTSADLAGSSASLSLVEFENITLKNLSEIKINDSLKQATTTYEDLVRLREKTTKTGPLDSLFALSLSYLSKFNYASSSATLKKLQADIDKKEQELVASIKIPENVKASNSAPASGTSTQKVTLDNGSEFLVNILAADLKTTKVLLDTASPGDCKNDCPVLPLGTFASRSGAFAAINGPYFCPSTYPSCADKKNSFDTLLMNKDKKYFNSDNNVYSSVPAAIFSTTSRFVERSSDWGRDTGVDSVIAGQPLLVSGGTARFDGDGDSKKTGKGTRAFIGATGQTVYIGLVYGASVADVSQVLAKLGIQNAINLDSGGSTAFWANGRYIAGPGRDLPFGIVLVRR